MYRASRRNDTQKCGGGRQRASHESPAIDSRGGDARLQNHRVAALGFRRVARSPPAVVRSGGHARALTSHRSCHRFCHIVRLKLPRPISPGLLGLPSP
ncbi:hypothetical protein RPC_3980 [Rhodopseudomonas palustris BisB18]|uniref:Uncharacterized protein n=1 Tax=Rhodopseudomonas palustris (strain BisB18) TaxID=316056 RepID=Q20ZD0_RHOPB